MLLVHKRNKRQRQGRRGENLRKSLMQFFAQTKAKDLPASPWSRKSRTKFTSRLAYSDVEDDGEHTNKHTPHIACLFFVRGVPRATHTDTPSPNPGGQYKSAVLGAYELAH